MFYKPNFCCNCGEKIQRAEWKLLSSRRFCDVCGIENQGYEWLPRVIVGMGAIAGIFGLGTVLGSRTTDQMVPLRIAQTADSRQNLQVPASKPQPLIQQTGQAPATVSSGPTGAELTEPPPAATKEQPRPRNSASDEPVYYCGALTKKGKPCSRRVKTKGRCWQHTRQPALEPTRQLDVY